MLVKEIPNELIVNLIVEGINKDSLIKVQSNNKKESIYEKKIVCVFQLSYLIKLMIL